MEFCLSIEIQEGMGYADTLAMTQAGEAAGFHAALLAEHYYASSGRPELMSADAWIFLGALARETTRIRLGTLVSPVTFRHPAVLAKLAASLDHVSAGRAELGIGAGWLLEEQLQIITGLWSQEPFSFSGAHYQLEECRFTPRPVQQRLPIIVGGDAGATRLPRLAARYADEYVIGRGSVALCREVRERLDRDCERAERDPAAVSLALFAGLCVAETEEEVARLLARLMEGARPHMQDTSTWILGTPEQAAERLRELSAAGVGRLMFSVDNELHREMVPLLGERVKLLVEA